MPPAHGVLRLHEALQRFAAGGVAGGVIDRHEVALIGNAARQRRRVAGEVDEHVGAAARRLDLKPDELADFAARHPGRLRVLTTTYLNFGHDRDFVFCVETAFHIDSEEDLRGHFLLLPDLASLKAIFDAIRLS